MVEYTLRTVSYQRCQQAQARQAVAGMSDVQKQLMLDTIKVQQGVHNLIGQQYDTKMLLYIEQLLTGGKNEQSCNHYRSR